MFLGDYELINIIYKVIIYIALPTIVAMILSSFLSGIFQSFLMIKESAISYCVRIIVLNFLLYFIYPVSREILIELVWTCLK